VLDDLVDGEHFFDIVVHNVIYEVDDFVGWSRISKSRAVMLDQFRVTATTSNRSWRPDHTLSR
jgi:hypothetical protein